MVIDLAVDQSILAVIMIKNSKSIFIGLDTAPDGSCIKELAFWKKDTDSHGSLHQHILDTNISGKTQY